MGASVVLGALCSERNLALAHFERLANVTERSLASSGRPALDAPRQDPMFRLVQRHQGHHGQGFIEFDERMSEQRYAEFTVLFPAGPGLLHEQVDDTKAKADPQTGIGVLYPVNRSLQGGRECPAP